MVENKCECGKPCGTFTRCFECNKKFQAKTSPIVEPKPVTKSEPVKTASKKMKTMKGYDFEELDERYNKFGTEFNIYFTQTDHLLVGSTDNGAKVLKVLTIYYD